MNYHIDTGLIWENFKKEGECPLCDLYEIVNARVVEQFTTEAVMEDHARDRVNRLGFCEKHFDQLFALPNKLGIALQTSTRLQHIRKHLTPLSKHAQVKREVERLVKEQSTCVLCDLNDFNMNRYYKTIAQMFVKENEFRALLENSKGFCVQHYAKLLECSGAAGLKSSEYVHTLYEVQKRNLDRLQEELDWFCDKFDYRNGDKPWGNSKDAPIRAIRKVRNR